MKIRELLSEAAPAAAKGPRIPHPEDSIFDGSASANQYVTGLKEVMTNPGGISIKWDGGIALYFGRDRAGRFFCSDKYMYPKGILATSLDQWIEYDKNRGADRSSGSSNLYDIIKMIWSGLEADVGSTKGVFKGDLLHAGILKPVDGKFVFSPTTVEYRIPVKSTIGTLIKGKVGIVAVHAFNNAPWDGKTGLSNAGNVAILSPTAGIEFKFPNPEQVKTLSDKATQAVSENGAVVDKFLSGMDGVAQGAIKKYFNKKITAQTHDKLSVWLKTNISDKQYRLLIGYIDPKTKEKFSGYLLTNAKAYKALEYIWNSIYQLKVAMAKQLEPQIQGFEQYTGGQKAGEGFVFNSPTVGLIKLVNRGVFGAAHFNK